MRFEYTDGNDKDFIGLCHGLDCFFNELVGGEENRSEYIQYNKLDDIHDVVIAYDSKIPVGCASFKKYDDETGVIHWEIPYSPGTLVAQGLNSQGEVESSYTINTSDRPYALKITSDTNEFNTPGQVAHLFIEVVDENGFPVKMADNEVTVRVTGDAKLLALESGDNTDMGNYRDNRQRVYGGKLLGYLKYHNDEPEPRNQRRVPFDLNPQNQKVEDGKIRIDVSSPYLKPASLTIK